MDSEACMDFDNSYESIIERVKENQEAVKEQTKFLNQSP